MFIVCYILRCIIETETASLLAHSDSDVVSNSSVDSVDTETTQEQKFLKGCQVLLIFQG